MKHSGQPIVGILTVNCGLIFLWLIYLMVTLDAHPDSDFLLPFMLGIFQLAMLFGVSASDTVDKVIEQAANYPTQTDPWALQRMLMKASDQPLPEHPVLDKGGVLYALLIMEEVGETFSAIASVLKRSESPMNVFLFEFSQHAARLQETSARLREKLVDVDINIPLTEQEAVELLDGTTDIAVVNCGLALACGLPGAGAYDEVVGSNLSKINPATGMIDKHPDGKWIKGIRYYKPDLRQVMIMSGCSFSLPTDTNQREPNR